MHAGSLERTREAKELLEAQPRATLASCVLSKLSQCGYFSIHAQLKHEPSCKLCTKKKEILIQLWQAHKVIVFYHKTMNEWKGKNDQQKFRDQIVLQRIVNVLLRSGKRTNILHARDRILSRLNSCLSENSVGSGWKFCICKILKLKSPIVQYF